MHCGLCDWAIEQEGGPARRADEVEQQMNRAGLAGPIGSQKSEDFTLLYLETQHLHGHGFAPAHGRFIGLAQILGADRRHSGYSFVIPSSRFWMSRSFN